MSLWCIQIEDVAVEIEAGVLEVIMIHADAVRLECWKSSQLECNIRRLAFAIGRVY